MHTTRFHRATLLTLLLALLVAVVPMNSVLTARAESIHNPGNSNVIQPIPPSCPAVTPSTFTNTTPVAIPTGAVVSSTITVSGANPYLWDVNLKTSITHAFAADLDITIQSPAGTIVTLTTDNGGGNDDVFDGTLWDDNANAPVTDHTFTNLTLASPLSPEEPLGAFIGEDPNGTWTLTISDDAPGDGGSLDGWSLDMKTSSGCAPALTVSGTNPSANATLPSLASMSVNFSEDVVNDGSGKAANNVANYLLVERGPNGVFDTLSCAAGQSGDDVKQTITSASYNSSGFTATVNLASPLASGNYRLFICGTTSIWSAAGRELNDGLNDSTVNFTIASSSASASTASALPNTGFAPGRVTVLPAQPAEKAYTQSELWIEIPKLGVRMDIVNVPQAEGTWDVSWLGSQAGWLESSALPTWSGNSVLTGHVWDANNQPGPFAELKTLKYGDRIIVHGFGQTYTYEVRENNTVSPTRISKVFKHEQNPWITLVTCEEYQENSQEYLYRRVVRAVLISVK